MKKSLGRIIAILIPVIIILIFFLVRSSPDGDIKKDTFTRLEEIRKNKKLKVVEYFKRVSSIAKGISDDSEMLNFFKTIRENNYITHNDLEYEIDKNYVNKYGDFYDILFVDLNGFIFYTIKREADFRSNLFKGKLASTKLAQRLKGQSKNGFIEFEYYSPSDESAAFFINPVKINDSHAGWFILQSPINRVNSILTDRDELGRTGEVYIVNKKKVMLSDSLFFSDSTTLKLEVDTQAVRKALKDHSGGSIIEDYRGVRVFSSFEKFDIFGVTWIIIAEIDEDEIITEYYKDYKNYFNKKICSYLKKYPRKTEKFIKFKGKTNYKSVDMNEFSKVYPGTKLRTSGVSTCTAVAILYPDKFGYMTHISPTDKIYLSGSFIEMFVDISNSDFLGELLRKINYYDVYPFEHKKLHFVIVAPHDNSFEKTVDKILDNDIELANIKFLYNPKARSANIDLDISENSVRVEWKINHTTQYEDAADMIDLGAIIKELIKYNS